MSEKEKFDILLSIIRLECSVKLFYKENRKKLPYSLSRYQGEAKTLHGECDFFNKKIIQHLIPDMSEDEWSEATSSLLHEYGHCMNYEPKERQAWKNAEKWIDKKFPILKPKRFAEIMKCDLEFYKNIKDNPKFSEFNLQY